MTKDLKVQIEILSSIDNGEFGKEENRISESGLMSYSDGTYSISYDEASENGKISCTITAKNSEITVVRKGATSSTMRFKEGVTHRSVYLTSGFGFDMEIKSKEVKQSLSLFGGEISLLYDMVIGGAPKSCKMTIKISL